MRSLIVKLALADYFSNRADFTLVDVVLVALCAVLMLYDRGLFRHEITINITFTTIDLDLHL